jgi:arsenite-transporting ATPase
MTHRLPEFLQNKDLRLLLFGGKGGVGKTTMAAASALLLARSRGQDKKIFVISTDPAHSLSDSLEVEIGDRVTAIQRSEVRGQRSETSGQTGGEGTCEIQNPESKIQNLFARELDATRLLDDFKQEHDGLIKKLAGRGTYFDQEDIASFLDLSLPGMDEVMAIIEIADLLKEGAYDVIIVDTAPTGHTMRMLNLPEQMLKWIETMDLMQHKHRYLSEVFSGKKYRKDACDRFLEDLSSDIDRVRKMLSDRETTRFVPVMIPEPMSIYETERLIRSLRKGGIPVAEMIVNGVAESDGCAFCRSKREDQEKPLMDIQSLFAGYDLFKVPLFSHEIRGVSGLGTIGESLSGTPMPSYPLKQVEGIASSGSCLDLEGGLEFIMFGGKGGVGKTTLAAAAALHIARRHPEKRVLLFSTDPAHSLSDSLNQTIGDEITPIVCGPKSKVQSLRSNVQGPESNIQRPMTNDVSVQHPTSLRAGGSSEPEAKVQSQMTNDQSPMTNLYALEIDAERLWGDFKAGFKSDVEALFDRFLARGADIRFDREAMTEMLEFAPPGVDEIMSLNRIMDLRNEGAFDIFVLDTSPTGHLLRFLELPDLVREWLRAFFRLLLKYKGVARLTGAAEKALALSRNVRRIQETLTDPEKTEFMAVTIAEAMGVLELERLMGALDTGQIPCGHIFVNKVVPRTACGFCSVRRAEQQSYIRRISSTFPDRRSVQAPLLTHQVQGTTDLNKLGAMVFCGA